MISSFRYIALGGSPRELRGVMRFAAHLARAIAFVSVLAFIADAINADILYAAAVGDIQFQDNPLILDSGCDSTFVIPSQVAPHINYFALARFDAGAHQCMDRHVVPHFSGTTITEDVDSPTVLDGLTTRTLTFSLRSYSPYRDTTPPSTYPTLDRTITYGILLI